jgi:hypothetical protein
MVTGAEEGEGCGNDADNDTGMNWTTGGAGGA